MYVYNKFKNKKTFKNFKTNKYKHLLKRIKSLS